MDSMLKLNGLRPAEGSRRRGRRVGRGPGSGRGKTCGYGSNGAKCRSGRSSRLYFEGGQTPLSRRIPKRGFANRNRTVYQIVNVGAIQKVAEDGGEVDKIFLHGKGLLPSKRLPLKVLGNGELSRGVTVKAEKFSASARAKIEAAKGKAEEVKGA